MHLTEKQPAYLLFKENAALIPEESDTIRPLNSKEWARLSHNAKDVIQFGDHYFAVEAEPSFNGVHGFTWLSLRSLFNRIGNGHFTPWSQAFQLLTWSRSHQYCGSCGGRTQLHPSQPARFCPVCNETFYPRISPCIIVLITRGDHILLARAAKFKKKIYSTLAGFIEIGETAEQTIHREIYEEVSIRVQNLTYFGSQPWPFPGQLMLGYFAEYESGEIQVDGDEIVDAHWFHALKLPEIPNKETIAGQLIRTYVNGRFPNSYK